jgi:enterochelin esterase-like enzyme
MTKTHALDDEKPTRRSILSGAVRLGGGAALSAAVPSLLKAAPDAAGEGRELLPIVGSASIAGVPANSTGVTFSQEFLSNRVFQDLALNFDPPSPPRVDGQPVTTGALAQPNGDIRFRIHAPRARDVSVKVDFLRGQDLPLARRNDGVFEGLVAYDESHTGPANVDVYVDGLLFLDPYLPIHWAAVRPRNFIEIPDPRLEFMFVKNVPHGAVSREIYWADALGSWERCLVYTPAGYMRSKEDYPVLYLQHGGGDNEIAWVYCGRLPYILDNLIAEGGAEPFIVVMNNAMVRYGGTGTGVVDDAFERTLVDSCIPHIEGTYRVKAGKWNRAIGGLSMGAYMSCDIGFRRPEVFGSIGTFTASMTHERFETTYTRPYPAVLKDPKGFAGNYRVYYRSTTPAEDHFEYFLADDKLCADAGVDKLPSYHRVVYPARTTKWNSWRLALRDYAQLLFR